MKITLVSFLMLIAVSSIAQTTTNTALELVATGSTGSTVTYDLEYGVCYLAVRVKDFNNEQKKFIKDMMHDGYKVYLTIASDDNIIVQASLIDAWLLEFAKEIGLNKLVIQSGKPNPPPCPPSNPNCSN